VNKLNLFLACPQLDWEPALNLIGEPALNLIGGLPSTWLGACPQLDWGLSAAMFLRNLKPTRFWKPRRFKVS